MDSRTRTNRALNFESVDRVPIDINLSFHAYLKLCKAIGFATKYLPKPSLAMEVCPDPRFFEKLGVDVYSIKFGGNDIFDGEFRGSLTDVWGISYRLVEQQNGMLYEVASNPLANASIADLDGYTWPSPPTQAMISQLHENAKQIYETTNLALVGRFGAPIIEIAVGLLGFEEWFIRLLTEPEFTQTLITKIESVATAWDLAGIEACGEFLSIMKVSGEDFGSQQSLLYSPDTIREALLPMLRKRWDAVHIALKSRNYKAKVMLHTCGAVKPIILDLIEAGIEVLDPIQPKAADMDPEGLYQIFGGRLVFHGGIDVQEVLPTGTQEHVREHVLAVINALHGCKGGYILSPSHTVQSDIPVENILALVDSVKNYNTE